MCCFVLYELSCFHFHCKTDLKHSDAESLGMGGEKRLGRKVPPQFGDQWGSLTRGEEAPLTTLKPGPERQKSVWAKEL